MLDQDTISMLQDVLAEGFVDVVHAFVGDGPNRIGAMRAAVAGDDLKALEMAAHTLKGSSSNVGASELHNLTTVLVDQCRAGSVKDASSQVDAIESCFEATKSALLALI